MSCRCEHIKNATRERMIMLAECLSKESKESYGVVKKEGYYDIITTKEAKEKNISLVYVTSV